MNPKYQIFISSTYEDLKEEREQVLKAILRLGHIPIGMEMFNAANETQWEMIKRRIEESDYYIVIIAHRYGSIEKESGLSYTEKEYDYAASIKVPTLGFVLSDSALWPGNRTDDDPDKQAALKKFVEKVESKMRSPWSNKDDLATAVSLSLNETITAFPRIGWVRANEVVNPETVNELTRLSKENAELRDRLAHLQENAQNVVPMPQLNIALNIIEGDYEWYEARQDTDRFGRMLYPLPVLQQRHGVLLQLVVNNSGTSSTNLSVDVSCDSPIVSSEDIEVLNEVNERTMIVSSVSPDGWHEGSYNATRQNWEFRGNVNSLRPGQEYDFVIPLMNEIELEAFEDTTITVNISPVTGKHIKQVFRVGDIVSL